MIFWMKINSFSSGTLAWSPGSLTEVNSLVTRSIAEPGNQATGTLDHHLFCRQQVKMCYLLFPTELSCQQFMHWRNNWWHMWTMLMSRWMCFLIYLYRNIVNWFWNGRRSQTQKLSNPLLYPYTLYMNN